MDQTAIDHEQLAKCLFAEANDAFFIFDPEDTRLLDVNPAAQRLTKMRRKRLLGLPLQHVLLAEPPRTIDEMAEAIQTTGSFHSEDGFFLIQDNGHQIPVNVSISRVHTQPKTLGLVVVRDVSKRKAAEDGLRVANHRLTEAMRELTASQHALIRQERLRAIGEMAGGMAHGLNNLLMPVVIYAELLMSDPDVGSQPRESIASILTCAHDAAAIVHNLQTFCRQGETELRTEIVDLAQLIAETTALTRPKWRNQPLREHRLIDIRWEEQPGVRVRGNSSRLREVLSNLLFNAVDAMPEGGEITIRVRTTENQFAVIEVTDTGIGMTREQCSRCMEPFVTTKRDGTGLGLSVSHAIVARHGGYIKVDSHIGQGTQFDVFLPMDEDIDEEAIASLPEDAAKPQLDPRPLSRPRLLYVDDERRPRHAMRLLAKSLHCDIEVAASGAEALSLLQTNAFDAVLSDLVMPEMDGLQLAEVIRTLDPELPVLILSGWDEATVLSRCEDPSLLASILPKPVSSSRLAAALESLHCRPSVTTNVSGDWRG